MNVTQLCKRKGKWKYKEKSVVQNKEEQEQIMRKCHDDKMTGHLDVRKTL